VDTDRYFGLLLIKAVDRKDAVFEINEEAMALLTIWINANAIVR
jgi:hypothetical protein